MQWLCIPSNVSMERRKHEAMNGWMSLLLKLDRLSSSTGKIYWRKCSSVLLQWFIPNEQAIQATRNTAIMVTLRMDTILISTKKIDHNMIPSMPRTFSYRHTWFLVQYQRTMYKKKHTFLVPKPESWKIKNIFLINYKKINYKKKIKNFTYIKTLHTY